MATVMTTEVASNPAMVPAYTNTTQDVGNQQAWSNFSATYNSSDQHLSITFNYDDGTHLSTIYDAVDGEFHADYLVSYDSAWGVTRIIFNYDDGTHTVASYDLADEFAYTDYLATFDAQWNPTRTIFINDDGTKSIRYYDVADEFDWSLIQFEYDSIWNLTATTARTTTARASATALSATAMAAQRRRRCPRGEHERLGRSDTDRISDAGPIEGCVLALLVKLVRVRGHRVSGSFGCRLVWSAIVLATCPKFSTSQITTCPLCRPFSAPAATAALPASRP